MCGIAGYLNKSDTSDAPIGKTLLRMLLALGCRGPDSAGVALYGREQEGGVLQIKLGEGGDLSARGEAVTTAVRGITALREATCTASCLRLRVAELSDGLLAAIERIAPDIEVVSAGRRLEVVKQVGSPEELEATFGISRFVGTHGIGHTRLSTESRIDLSHSQPFWAHGLPDVATVHNGHITNYHILRRRYEQRGIHFYTENDSEIIGIYLRDRLQTGFSFEEALSASLSDFDGSFCYLAATPDMMAFVKDSFGLKPLVIAETDEWAAIATEEIALRNAFGTNFAAREPGVQRLHIWEVPLGKAATA
jgi:methylamine---glutamate N-methyltransferase subunit A